MRIVAVAVLVSMCHAPVVLAGETLRQAAVREADRLAAAEAAAARGKQTASAQTPAVVPRKPLARKPKANFQQSPRGLEGATGIGTRTKILLGAGIAAALVGIMAAIDGSVEDNTPSTKGERTNEPF
jgi:uncharacterized membrane protein YdbT with pleckstrin-like domain